MFWHIHEIEDLRVVVQLMCLFQTIQEDKTQKVSLDVGTYLLKELAKLRDKYEIIGDVRGKGLMIGVEMVTDKVLSVEQKESLTARVCVACADAPSLRGTWVSCGPFNYGPQH